MIENPSAPRYDAEYWRQFAVRLRQEGKLSEAGDACRRALEYAPADAETWSELAHALRLDGRFDEAREAATRAIELEPRLAGAWFNLGAVLLAQGDAAQSVEANRRALEFKPDFAEAWSNLGGALAASGDKAGEINAYRQALAINPLLAPVWSNLGNALGESDQLEEAVAACQRAVELDPHFATAWNNLGNALLKRGEHEAAIRACESALRLAPKLAEAWSTLGAALRNAKRHDEAISAYRKAVEIQPRGAELHFKLGTALQSCGRAAEAISCFRRTIELDAGHADAHFELGFALLRAGELREGWEEYEWRLRRRGAPPKRYDFAPWDGDTSRPCRLLLWGDQGIGDEIIYGSMFADLVDSPLSIALEVNPRLVSLYQRSFPGVPVLAHQKRPAALPAGFDCQSTLAGLGRWLRRSFDCFPRRHAFLKPDPARVEEYRGRLGGNREARIVGISWKSANKEFGEPKSSELQEWVGILQTPRCRFVDLQYGDTASERATVEQEAGVRIEHLPDVDLFNDLEGLAALCTACDLVISVSNVTAHMAGALGRPVWLVAPKVDGRFWYWFSGRSDSPWYPTMRIFDQVVSGSWRETLDGLAEELAAFVTKRQAVSGEQ